MAETKKNPEAGFQEEKSAFAGENQPQKDASVKRKKRKKYNAHQPRDANGASKPVVNHSNEPKKIQPGSRAEDKSAFGKKSRNSSAKVQRKRKQGQQFRKKNSAKQSENTINTDDIKSGTQGGFSQEQSQFIKNSREEPHGAKVESSTEDKSKPGKKTRNSSADVKKKPGQGRQFREKNSLKQSENQDGAGNIGISSQDSFSQEQSQFYENSREEPNGTKFGSRAEEKSGSGKKTRNSSADIKKKPGQERKFREKNSFKQSENTINADDIKSSSQGDFSQEQRQFFENSREEPEGEKKEFKEGYNRKDTSSKAGAKGRYRRRQNSKYQKRERQKGEYQVRKCQEKADQENKEKSREHKEKSGCDFQAENSTFSEDTEKVFEGSEKLDRMQQKAERAGRHTEKARKKLPKRREYSLERVFDENEGRAKYVLTIVNKEKLFKPDSPAKAVAGKVVREPANYAHKKIAEVEKENSAVEGAHKAEQKAGDVYRYVKRYHRTKLQRQRRRVAKLEKKQFKKEVNFHYQKFLEENSEMSEKTLKRQIQKRIQKRIQKQRIKREYAKAKRAGQAANYTKEVAAKTANTATATARKLQEAAATHASVLVSAGALVLLLIIVITTVSSCGALFSDGASNILAGAYMSAPTEIDAVELAFTMLEMELQKEVDSIETDYPDYDEYHYSIDDIGHDPFVLISYLSAVYTEFTASGVQGEVESLFDEMYDLTLTPTQETRTRTVTKTGTMTVTDPVTGMEVEEEYEYEEEEEYTVTILEVTLTAASLEAIISGRMDGEQQSVFDLYHNTQGLIQQFYSPLDLSWHTLVSSYYGYRIHPISGAEQLHRGVDIAVPTGTTVYAAMDGTVTTAAYDSAYGNYVVIEDNSGYCTKYAHMDTLSVSAGQTVRHGDEIGTSGNTGNSTGSHLHIECMYNGEYYNPLFYFCGQ